MAERQIRWNRGNEISLKIAVNAFNKRINELQKIEERAYLPELIDYTEVKSRITTESELKRYIKSLRKFKTEGAESLYITEGGEKITSWEWKQLGKQTKILQNRLEKELTELNKPLESGYSRVQMGSIEARQIEAQLNKLKKLGTKTKSEFKKEKERIQKQGTYDYLMRKSIIYKQNYINEMRKYAHFKNYDKLVEKMKKIENPIEFYESIKDKELLADLTYQSDEYYTQEEFNRFLEDWGIEIDEEIEELEDVEEKRNKKYKYSLIARNGVVVAESDSRQTLLNIVLNSKDADIANGWIRENY